MAKDKDNKGRQNDASKNRQQAGQNQRPNQSQQQPQGQQPPQQPQGQQPPQQPQGQQPQGQQPVQQPQGQQPPQQPQGQQQDDEIEVIAPLSDELLSHIDHVLPDQWSEDETTLEVVQWVIYLFFRETDDDMEAAKRMRKAMDMASDRFETDRKTVKRVCTTTLYRDEDDDSTDAFRDDVRMIHELYQS